MILSKDLDITKLAFARLEIIKGGFKLQSQLILSGKFNLWAKYDKKFSIGKILIECMFNTKGDE